MPLTVNGLTDLLAEVKTWPDSTIILLSGGSCSGKTELALALGSALRGTVVHGDDWALPSTEVLGMNLAFGLESPKSYDLAGICAFLQDLLSFGHCDKPVFDFFEDRVVRTETVHYHRYLIVEFLHACHLAIRRTLVNANFKCVLVEADMRVRLMRRLKRDLNSRGKRLQDVIREWQVVLTAEREYLSDYRAVTDLLFRNPTPFALEEFLQLTNGLETDLEARSALLGLLA